MSIDYIVELIDEEESLASTINTEHSSFEGSEDQRSFKLHQENIMKLKKCFLKYTTMQTALRQIRSTASFSHTSANKIADIAHEALTNS